METPTESTSVEPPKGVVRRRASPAPMPLISENREVFEQRDDAEHDDDDAHDVLCAAVDRQHVHEVENENDDQEGDQDADEHGG